MNNNIVNIDYNTNPIELKDIEFQANSTYTLLSCRKSGKSYMIRNLVYLLLKQKKIDVIYLFSYTADIDDAYNFIDKSFIFNPDIMGKTIDLIFQMQKAHSKRKVCIICDDFDLTSSNDSLNSLYTRGRHYNITTILSAQVTTKGISTSIRNNTIYLFVRKLNARTIKDYVYQMLLNTEFDDPKTFYNFVKNNNENYSFILYFNDDRPSKDSISVVKATKVSFKFGKMNDLKKIK